MTTLSIASIYIFIGAIAIVVLFQAALAAGMPWGKASMGGRFPGKYPPRMRIVAAVHILILLSIAIIVLSKARYLFPQMYAFSRYAIWVVIAFFAVGTVMNAVSPSRIERIWAPVNAILCLTSLIIALSNK